MGVQNIKVSEKEQQLLIKVDQENRSSALTFVLSFSIFTAVCSSFLCGFSSGYSSPVESGILKDLQLSNAEYSLFGSMLTVGGLFGALISGKLTDFIGCRRIMGLSSIISFGGWLSIGYSQGTMSLDIGRVALGLSNGIASYVVPVYIAEISPKEIRGGLVLVHQLIVCCGISSAFIVGLVASWRALAFIGTIQCMIQILGLFFIPESPRWLVMRSSEEVFEQALKQFRGQNKDISHEAAEISVIDLSLSCCPIFLLNYALFNVAVSNN